MSICQDSLRLSSSIMEPHSAEDICNLEGGRINNHQLAKVQRRVPICFPRELYGSFFFFSVAPEKLNPSLIQWKTNHTFCHARKSEWVFPDNELSLVLE